MLLIAGRRLCNLIGVRFTGSSRMTCAVYSIIHHPLSAVRAELVPDRLVRRPRQRGGVYWRSKAPPSFQGAGRPRELIRRVVLRNAVIQMGAQTHSFTKHDGSPPFHSSIWVNPLITMRSSYPEMLPPDTSARAHKICGQGRSLLHCGSICGCPPGSG